MNKFRQLCLLLCCSFLFLSGFSPVVSHAATNIMIGNDNFSYPIMINREKLNNGIYVDSYKITETFVLYGFPENVTLRGVLDIKKDVKAHVFEFHNNNSQNNYIDIRADISTISINYPSGKFVIGNSSGHGAYERKDNFGTTTDLFNSYAFIVQYCDYFPGTSEIELVVEYNVTVYSSTDEYKFELHNNGYTVNYNGVRVELGNTLDATDAATQSYLQQLIDKTTEISNKIEDIYEKDETEDFGVTDIVDQLDEKAGALTFATDVLIGFLDLFSPENEMSSTITFPSFTINVQGVDYEVWEDYEYNLLDLEENFGVLLEALRWGTTMLVYVALISYIGKCWDSILGG